MHSYLVLLVMLLIYVKEYERIQDVSHAAPQQIISVHGCCNFFICLRQAHFRPFQWTLSVFSDNFSMNSTFALQCTHADTSGVSVA
jgi:hypothetical protein